MAESKKVTYIQSSEHAIVGESEGQSAILAPGERVLLNEDAASHKTIARLIEAGDESVKHLSLVEVDPKAEKAAAEEQAEMLEKAEKIAAKQRDEEAQEATDALEKQLEVGEGQSPHSDPTDFPPQDVEAQRLGAESEGDEEHGAKSGRRSARSKAGGK